MHLKTNANKTVCFIFAHTHPQHRNFNMYMYLGMYLMTNIKFSQHLKLNATKTIQLMVNITKKANNVSRVANVQHV